MKPNSFLLPALVILAACAEPGAAPDTPGPNDVQATAPGRAVCMKTSGQENHSGASATNNLRRNAGLPPVRANMLLAEVAADHACDMAQRGRMTHKGSATSGPGSRVKAAGYAPTVTAENIAAGPFSLPRVLHEWNSSAGHRNNILIPQVQDYGIGQAVAADGRTRFWAAVYAAPKP